MSNAPNVRPSLLPGPRDAYAELLRDTRGLRREQQQARDAWYAKLPWDTKEDFLFELEILVKGIACFSNPRNHPGPPRRAPVVAIDFSRHLGFWRDGVARVVDLSRQLLGTRDRAFVFQRYLETVLPEDTARTRLVHEAMAQASPEESLFVLRHGLTHVLKVTDGALRLTRVPYRLFFSLAAMAQREIAQNSYFNPLSALEFRPEFDRIRSNDVLELIGSVPGEQAHRLVALTFLSLFRMLRYLRLIESIAAELGDERKRPIGRAYLVLAVIRSDARALSSYLKQRSGILMADSFERDLFSVPSHEMRGRYEALYAEGYRLISIKSALEGIAASVRLEMRRAYEHELPSPDSGATDAEFRQRLRGAVNEIRPALENAILFFGRALGVGLKEDGVFDSGTARRETSERLRRDVWMFAQIVRAFGSKAVHAEAAEDRWHAARGFAFVREFLSYFRAMGYPLLRASDYPRVDAFMAAMGALEDTDLVDAAKMEQAVIEANAFHGFLVQLFEQISKRDELRGVGFDRKRAAESLKLYLGE